MHRIPVGVHKISSAPDRIIDYIFYLLINEAVIEMYLVSLDGHIVY